MGMDQKIVFPLEKLPPWPQLADHSKAVWCSADRRSALTRAKAGEHINTPSTCANPVQQHYAAGESIGVNATPILILPDGELVRGYVPAQPLAARLAQIASGKTASR